MIHSLKHFLLMLTVNKVRLILTAVGIFVAVFLFSLGSIIVNSYYAGYLRVIEDMQDYTVVVTSSQNSVKVKDDISHISNAQPIDIMLPSEKRVILSVDIESHSLIFATRMEGVSNINHVVPVFTDGGLLLPVRTRLVQGRLITTEDIQAKAQVVVIDEFTAELLFPKGDCIGKVIEFGAGVGVIDPTVDDNTPDANFEIIGVVKNSRVAEEHRLALKSKLSGSEKNIFLDTTVYCPISTINERYKNEDFGRFYVFSFSNSTEYQSFTRAMFDLVDVSARRGVAYDVSTKQTMRDATEQDLSSTKTVLNVIMLILCIVTGLSIMGTAFFAVKERIPEIGIRKAFGASKVDILFQFMFEMIVIALVTSIIAVCLSFFLCKIAEGFLGSQLFVSFTVQATPAQLLLPVLVGVTEAALCGLIPSFYATQVKVTDSLRFE